MDFVKDKILFKFRNWRQLSCCKIFIYTHIKTVSSKFTTWHNFKIKGLCLFSFKIYESVCPPRNLFTLLLFFSIFNIVLKTFYQHIGYVMNRFIDGLSAIIVELNCKVNRYEIITVLHLPWIWFFFLLLVKILEKVNLFQTRRYVPEKLHMVNIYSLTLLLFPAVLSILSSIVQFQLQNCVYIVENVIINLISTNNFWWKNNICDDIEYWLNIKKIKCPDIEDQAFLFITHLVECFSSPVVFLGYLSLFQL